MLKETSELLKEYYGLDDETFELSNEVMEDIKDQFDKIKETWKTFALTESARTEIEKTEPMMSEREVAARLRETSEAKNMIGRTPGSIVAVRPLKDGVIADFDITATMLKHFIRQATKSSSFGRPHIVVCIPSGVTEVERRAVEDAARQAGANHVDLIEEPMAAAIGAGLPVGEPCGSMVVDIGGGSTEVAVISLGDIVTSCSVRIAGDKFDEAIINYVKRKYNLLIGERTAEAIKMTLGSAYPNEEIESSALDIKGRNMADGLPKNVTITGPEVREALEEPLGYIVDAIKNTLEKTPPELAADIIDNGIMLTGGGALIRGLDRLITQETGMPVHVAENAIDCVAEGTGKRLEIELPTQYYKSRRK